MMLLWALAGIPLGAYNIVEDFNVALQIQPQILTALSLGTWIQCYYYDDVRSLSLYASIVSELSNLGFSSKGEWKRAMSA